MDQGGNISFLSESRRKLDINVPGENRPLYYGAGVVLLVILVFAGGKFYTSFLAGQLTKIDNQLTSLETQRDKEFEQELLRLNKQFPLVGNFLAKHSIWSNVLIKFQSLTPPQVRVETLLGNTNDGKLEIKGRAANYTTIAKMIAALLSDKSVIDVSLDKVASFSTGDLEYNIRILFDKDKFLLNK